MKTPDANYDDPLAAPKPGMLSKIGGIFHRKPKKSLEIVDDMQIEVARREHARLTALLEKEEKKKQADAERVVQRPSRLEQVGPHKDVDLQDILDRTAYTPPKSTPAADKVIRDRVKQAIEDEEDTEYISKKSAKRISRAITATILGIAFIVGIVGANIVYTHLPTYPMVTVGIVAVSVSSGIITSMAR